MNQNAQRSGIVLEPYQIVMRPLVTEKGIHKAERCNQYAFEVNLQADKEEIRDAIEHLFNVRVVRVNTQTRKGKPRRTRMKEGLTKAWKKAIVTLHADDKISFF